MVQSRERGSRSQIRLPTPDFRLIIFTSPILLELERGCSLALEVAMAEHDEVYNEERAQRLAALLRSLAARIQELDQAGQLLRGGPELLRLMGDARSELFHYEVRSTYDTPEVADNRRIVEEAQRQDSFLPDEPEDDEPWRRRRSE
jgi:hypothetical protein